jgi:hypothetical protein
MLVSVKLFVIGYCFDYNDPIPSHPFLSLIGERKSKSVGKRILLAILLIPSPIRRGVGRGLYHGKIYRKKFSDYFT